MKKYEYKFIEGDLDLPSHSSSKKLEDAWNELGKEGWKFCSKTNNLIIFIRESED